MTKPTFPEGTETVAVELGGRPRPHGHDGAALLGGSSADAPAVIKALETT